MLLHRIRPIHLRRMLHTRPQNGSTYDVVVIGGGLVGACAACAIASTPTLNTSRVLVIEPRESKPWTTAPEKFSNRVYSVAPGTKKLLEELNVWKIVQKFRYRPVKRLQVWESATDALIVFQNDGLAKNVSYVVEDEVLSASLWTRLGQLDSVDVYHGTAKYTIPSRSRSRDSSASGPADAASGLEEETNEPDPDDLVKLTLSTGEKIESRLLIGADGFNSAVRKAMGVKYLSWNYDQKGVVATLHLSEAQENAVGWQRFTSTGPIAILPLNETKSSLVWSTSSDEANRLMRLSDEEFLDAVNFAMWDDSGKNGAAQAALKTLENFFTYLRPSITLTRQIPPTLTGIDQGSRAAFPLGLGHATQYVAPRVALIGDSAHRIHPLAGLGVNLGFSDVAVLRRVIQEAAHNGEDIGSLRYLLDYERDAQRRVVPIMAAVDGLNRLYSTSWSPAVTLRSAGLNFVNACDPLKRQIMRRASL
ncbi:hypothetical protein RvY_12951-2 [Ramazzottius varieornatus]|nr:hypothetical protein RvY_12951-2 [Ramazzottius varieornatus]